MNFTFVFVNLTLVFGNFTLVFGNFTFVFENFTFVFRNFTRVFRKFTFVFINLTLVFTKFTQPETTKKSQPEKTEGVNSSAFSFRFDYYLRDKSIRNRRIARLTEALNQRSRRRPLRIPGVS
jgi:hypothetical protein